jgi:hypothetical protein
MKNFERDPSIQQLCLIAQIKVQQAVAAQRPARWAPFVRLAAKAQKK